MQLIVDTDPTVDISTMTELKDITIREKLVNNIMEDLNLCSSNKENIKRPEYLICNGNISDKEKVIDKEEPILEKIQENIKQEIIIDSENGNVSTNIESDAVNGRSDDDENKVESQHVSKPNSPSQTENSVTKGQSLIELKYILKKEIEDSLIQENHEDGSINMPVENDIENNDLGVTMEELDNTDAVIDVNQSQPNDCQENKELCTNVTETLEESKMDVIEVVEKSVNVTSPKETKPVSRNPNVMDHAIKQNEVKDKSDEVNCMDTVIIDDKDNSLVEDNECMEVDNEEEEIIQETNFGPIIDCEEVSEPTQNSIEDVIKEISVNPVIDCDEVSDPTQNSIVESTKENNFNPITDCEGVSENTQNSIEEMRKETNANPIIDCEEVSESTQNSIVDIVKETNCNPTIDCEEISEPTQNSITGITKETNVNPVIDCEDVSEPNQNSCNEVSTSNIMDISKDDIVVVEEDLKEIKASDNKTKAQTPEKNEVHSATIRRNSSICRLSNNLDILSDDDEDENVKAPKADDHEEPKTVETPVVDRQCINIEEDDDIMLIEEDSPPKDVEKCNEEIKETLPDPVEPIDNKTCEMSKIDDETGENKSTFMESIELVSNKNDKEAIAPLTVVPEEIQTNEETVIQGSKQSKIEKPLLPENILSLSKKKLSDMTRQDLEEFCILKIVESVMDRSQLSDIKVKLKSMTQNLNEYRRRADTLAKQNRDLQVVLKSVQEEQKKLNETYKVITPLKLNRSVGLQVQILDKSGSKRKNSNSQNTRPAKSLAQSSTRGQKLASNQSIPVPRLVPASNTALKSPATNIPNVPNNVARTPPTSAPNGVKPAIIQKAAEKRPFSKTQAVTVDLTDDEPPAKMQQRISPAPPVRVVPSQNLMATPRQQSTLSQMVNSPRKVFIPIGASNAQSIRSGHAVMLKSVSPNGPRPRGPCPNVIRAPTQGRVRAASMSRHPAPLPDATRQYQPPNWKALPPAPDLKLSKVDNGIVISWKIDGYQEDLFEQIASYQLYAYQETNSPPSTALWKKIGDVAALPLPMACTLTQFTAGFKYFFAVRAVDVRSRIGPFSLPGSILLLKTM